MQKEAFEPTGLIPRSIIRTFDRFRQQLLPGTEQIAIQEYRISRYQILVSIKALCTLIFVPFLVTHTVNFFVITPVTGHFWDYQQGDIFLNSYQEKRAFNEMRDFSEKIFFESLVDSTDIPVRVRVARTKASSLLSLDLFLAEEVQNQPPFLEGREGSHPEVKRSFTYPIEQTSPVVLGKFAPSPSPSPSPSKGEQVLPAPANLAKVEGADLNLSKKKEPILSVEDKFLIANQDEVNTLNLQIRFQTKSLEIAETYNKESILAITCLLGDFVTLLTLYTLFVLPQMRPQVIILKSFLTESLYSLSDTTKSFLLILGMDLLVGFHSPRGWEIFLESALRHFGLPENESFILLFVALFPVFLDTVFKYWIFRYLNKISPSTVVTYHSMLE